jgi:hypothetical protein
VVVATPPSCFLGTYKSLASCYSPISYLPITC